MHFVTGKYRVGPFRTRVLAVLFGAYLFGGVAGCTGFAEQARSDNASAADGYKVANDLYQSMMVVFLEETAGVEYASEERFTIISDYESVDGVRRRRFVGRVVPVGSGIGIRITAEYQQEVITEGEQEWIDEPREAVEEEASPEELRLARRVERIYHRGDY